nr:hypothetical protein [Tanacetum cinerariifolium]
MWNSIQNGPYMRPMILDPDGAENIDSTIKQILEPFSKMTEGNKKQYITDVKVMNYLLQAIPNDIYNSVDACKNTKEMWERITRLMFGFNVTSHVRHLRLMDEFDKFAAKEGESLESMYERLTTLMNIMERNNVLPISIIQTKKAAKNHDPLAVIALSNASSFTISCKFFLFTTTILCHTSFIIVDYKDEYQMDIQGDSQEDKLTTAMMLLARAITQKFSTLPIIKPRVCDVKYFREQMLLAMKDEARSNLNNEENDFMLDTSYCKETMEELTVAIMLMARIQPADGNSETVPSNDAKAVSEVNASSKVHEQMHHEKRKTIIQTSDDDQIDSNIVFDDPYVENNGGTPDHDLNDHEEYHKIQMLAYDVQREAKNKEND